MGGMIRIGTTPNFEFFYIKVVGVAPISTSLKLIGIGTKGSRYMGIRFALVSTVSCVREQPGPMQSTHYPLYGLVPRDIRT